MSPADRSLPCPEDEPELEIAEDALPPLEGQDASFERVIVIARALPAWQIRPIRIDARLACANARAAYHEMLPHMAKARELPGADIEKVELLADLPGAVLYAYRLVELVDPPKRNVTARLARARKLRYMLLHQARAAVAAGLLPEAPVERIAKGKGPIDTAEDLVALATLYRQNEAALEGRIVATSMDLQEASVLGAELQEDLHPARAPKPKPSPDDLAKAKSDQLRLVNLLALAHQELLRVANYLGIAVPALQSRAPLRRRKAAEEA